MGEVREVNKRFCILSAAYIVIGALLLIWPDISVKTLCYVFGVGMLIFGGAYMILYFNRDHFQGVMQTEMVIGVLGLATGAFILMKMEYVQEIIPFGMGVIALLGAMVKLQNAFDLKKLGAVRWAVMLIWACIMLGIGIILIINPFDEQSVHMIAIILGISLLLDGIGNLVGMFWIGHIWKKLRKMPTEPVNANLIDEKPTKLKRVGGLFGKHRAHQEEEQPANVYEVQTYGVQNVQSAQEMQVEPDAEPQQEMQVPSDVPDGEMSCEDMAVQLQQMQKDAQEQDA